MNRTRSAQLYVLVASIALLVASIAHASQQPAPAGQQTPPPAGPKPGEQAATGQRPGPKNLKVLKGAAAGAELIPTMRGFNSALGVECNFCHHAPFDADTPRKDVARLMLRDYTMDMKHKDGSAVTCNDCHKGQANFLRTRPFENVLGKATKGLQILKGASEDRLTAVMTAFTKALGVDCGYCHTNDFEEETPRKQIARFMMTEFSLNLVKQDGSPVNCTTCHQGNPRPLAVLPFPRREQHGPAPAGEQPKKPGV
jgi:nitrate/TMAO reductase-like tetraheme cytochrome c subunit